MPTGVDFLFFLSSQEAAGSPGVQLCERYGHALLQVTQFCQRGVSLAEQANEVHKYSSTTFTSNTNLYLALQVWLTQLESYPVHLYTWNPYASITAFAVLVRTDQGSKTLGVIMKLVQALTITQCICIEVYCWHGLALQIANSQ